jgi:hypothetical protein
MHQNSTGELGVLAGYSGNPEGTGPRSSYAKSLDLRLISAVLLFIFVCSATFAAIRKDVTIGFDELAHISYVADLQSKPWGKRLDELRMLDASSFRRTAEPSYLNHPPDYYRAMAAIGPRIEGHPESIIWYRLMNVAIAGFGLALLFALSLSIARSMTEALLLIVPLSCIPVLPALAGSVNNDNLGFFAGALALFGSWHFLRSGRTGDVAIALLGLVLAGAAKLTALMLCGCFLLLLYLLARPKIARLQLSLALAAMALAAAPVVALWLEYGSPAPDTPGQHALLVSGSNLTGWADQPRLGAYEYALHFVSNFVAGWKPLLSERTPLQSLMLLLPSITVAFALISVMILARELFRSKRADPEALLAVAGAAAVAATFLVHVAFSYRRHLETGWMMDAYPRYYLPLVFVIPLATMMFVRSMAAPRARRAVAGFLVGAPMLFGLICYRCGLACADTA